MRLSSLALPLAALALAGCSSPNGPDRVPAHLDVFAGNGQTGSFGTALPDSLAVQVRNAVGLPVPGVAVTWSPASGSVSPAVSTTDANGYARTAWTLGPSGRDQVLAAAVANLPPVVFLATAEFTRHEDDFSINTLGSYSIFTEGGADWSIAGGVLTGRGPGIQTVLIRTGTSLADGWVETVSSHADDGGLVVRFVDPGNYYLLAFRDDAAPNPFPTANLALYHHVGGAYREMWVGDVTWPRGTTHTIRLQAAGQVLSVLFDGVQRISLTPSAFFNDPQPSFSAGAVGLRYYGDSPAWVTTFDTFRWQQQ